MSEQSDTRARIAMSCLIDIGGALEQLHGEGLCHGDIQTSSIMWEEERDLFTLVDFETTGNRERLRYPSFTPGSHIDQEHFRETLQRFPEGIERQQRQDVIALCQVCYRLASGKPPEGAYDGFLRDAGLPPYLRPWVGAFNTRWSRPDMQDWACGALMQEAVASNVGCFVAGVTEDTKTIRDRIFQARGIEDWFVQNHVKNYDWLPTLEQLYAHIKRARAVIFLLGRSSGHIVENVPPDLRKRAQALGHAPTYIVCEYLIAKELSKQMLFYDVDDPDEGPAPSAEATPGGRPNGGVDAIRNEARKDRGPLKCLSKDTCVGEVINDLKELYSSV